MRVGGKQGALVGDDSTVVHRVSADLAANHPLARHHGIQVATWITIRAKVPP